MNRRPDFFIVGAPKCGTTSLAAWLAEHPRIYISPVKEPHHFNTDDNYLLTPTRKLYERLFAGATDAHQALGEASVWYLYSTVAIPNILAYNPGARFIVCLRNPVEMAYSLHEQQVVAGNEDVTAFEAAWRLQEHRLRGEKVSRWCKEPRHLAYGPACALGFQIERLFERAGRDRVLPLLLDDVKADARRAYLRVLAFLGVDDDGRVEFPAHNPAKERPSPLLRKLVLAAGRLKRKLGIYRGLGVLNAIDRQNLRHRPRVPMDPKLRRELQGYFAPEVKKLGSLLDRDLSAWLDA
jgi:hypothetical protein